jgi:hypothetical protein
MTQVEENGATPPAASAVIAEDQASWARSPRC